MFKNALECLEEGFKMVQESMNEDFDMTRMI